MAVSFKKFLKFVDLEGALDSRNRKFLAKQTGRPAYESMEDKDPVRTMAAQLAKAGFKDVHVEDSYKPGKPHVGFVISFARVRKNSSDTFSLFYDMKKAEWGLSVQGDSHDLEVDFGLKDLAEIRKSVRGVTNAWFREADPDWTD